VIKVLADSGLFYSSSRISDGQAQLLSNLQVVVPITMDVADDSMANAVAVATGANLYLPGDDNDTSTSYQVVSVSLLKLQHFKAADI
jgi:hypothetical protein